MKELTQSEVERIAELAHIKVSAESLALTTTGLQKVLAFGGQLQSIDTTDVLPTSQVTGLTDVLREDVVITSPIAPAELLARAPEHSDGYFKVKRVLK